MTILRRKLMMPAAAAMVASGVLASGALAEPKTNLLHQWHSGSNAEAINVLGEMFEAQGGSWNQTAIPGHTSNTIARLRADVISETRHPPCSSKDRRSENGPRPA